MLSHAKRQQNTVQALLRVKHILDSHHVIFWLDYGTLLGAVRDKEMIKWDTDMDFGMLIKDFNKIIDNLEAFERNGFSVIFNPQRLFFSVVSPENRFYPLNFDVMHFNGDYGFKFWQSKRRFELRSFQLSLLERCVNLSNLWVGSTSALKAAVSKLPEKFRCFISGIAWKILFKMGCYMPHVSPKHHFETLDTIRFYGKTFLVPSSTNAYLTLHYGNWKTPRREWCYYMDAGERRPELLNNLA